VSAPPSGPGWVYAIKFDRYRILARIRDGEVRLFTRNGNDWTSKVARLTREIGVLPCKTAWLDGEVVVLDDRGLSSFNALQKALYRVTTESIDYFVFDLVYLDGRDLRGQEFAARRAKLERLLESHEGTRVRLSQIFAADGPSVLQSACRLGHEGIVAKRTSSLYTSARTKTWLKVKCQQQRRS